MIRGYLRWFGAALLLALLSACGQSAGSGAGMDHGSMAGADHGATTTGDGAPYDARFIDSMIEHHQGAIAMARDALAQSQRPELRQLAETIISDQQREIEQMQGWRAQWYPGLAPSGGMGMSMGQMSVGGDASQPYEARFIDSMIEHHQGAIAMARDALSNAEHAEIRELAQAIISAQQAEITQMEQWRRQWFGGS